MWLISILLVLIGFWFGQNVPFADQWPQYEALRTTAAIIFAVLGAWMAIVFPERLRLSFDGSKPWNSEENQSNFGRLLMPATHSTLIVGIILLIGVIAPIASQMPLVEEHKALARGGSYGVLTILTLWQFWTVILTLVPLDMLHAREERESRAAMLDGKLGGSWSDKD